MLGDAVWPDEVARVAAPMQAELAAQRDRLLAVLDAGGRALAPEDAALAQVSFDCWLSEARDTRNLDFGVPGKLRHRARAKPSRRWSPPGRRPTWCCSNRAATRWMPSG